MLHNRNTNAPTIAPLGLPPFSSATAAHGPSGIHASHPAGAGSLRSTGSDIACSSGGFGASSGFFGPSGLHFTDRHGDAGNSGLVGGIEIRANVASGGGSRGDAFGAGSAGGDLMMEDGGGGADEQRGAKAQVGDRQDRDCLQHS